MSACHNARQSFFVAWDIMLKRKSTQITKKTASDSRFSFFLSTEREAKYKSYPDFHTL